MKLSKFSVLLPFTLALGLASSASAFADNSSNLTNNTQPVFLTASSFSTLAVIKDYTLNGITNYKEVSPIYINKTGNVTLSLVQWPEDDRYNPNIGYQLVATNADAQTTQEIFVTGTFIGSNNTIRTFTNVHYGSYKLVIKNYGVSALYGNGTLSN
jgi:hypothetical protein